MATYWKALILAAMAAVAFVLALGMVNMAGGKSMDYSQRLMRWRIALQLIAIVVIMAAIYFAYR
jgi:amino acid transporter